MKKNNSKNNNRRDFLKKGALAASSFFIVPRYVLGGNGFTSPSDKINIAGIGVGGCSCGGAGGAGGFRVVGSVKFVG